MVLTGNRFGNVVLVDLPAHIPSSMAQAALRTALRNLFAFIAQTNGVSPCPSFPHPTNGKTKNPATHPTSK